LSWMRMRRLWLMAMKRRKVMEMEIKAWYVM
jgi:hypothetical protein